MSSLVARHRPELKVNQPLYLACVGSMARRYKPSPTPPSERERPDTPLASRCSSPLTRNVGRPALPSILGYQTLVSVKKLFTLGHAFIDEGTRERRAVVEHVRGGGAERDERGNNRQPHVDLIYARGAG